jgi:hypothetical protein
MVKGRKGRKIPRSCHFARDHAVSRGRQGLYQVPLPPLASRLCGSLLSAVRYRGRLFSANSGPREAAI